MSELFEEQCLIPALSHEVHGLDIKKTKKTIILFTGNLSRVHVTVLVPLRDLAAFLW